MMCLLLQTSGTWLLSPALLPTSTAASIINRQTWRKVYRLQPASFLTIRIQNNTICQEKRDVREAPSRSELLRDGREYLQRGNIHQFSSISINQLKPACCWRKQQIRESKCSLTLQTACPSARLELYSLDCTHIHKHTESHISQYRYFGSLFYLTEHNGEIRLHCVISAEL